jgi:hypothetical protein
MITKTAINFGEFTGVKTSCKHHEGQATSSWTVTASCVRWYVTVPTKTSLRDVLALWVDAVGSYEAHALRSVPVDTSILRACNPKLNIQ